MSEIWLLSAKPNIAVSPQINMNVDFISNGTVFNKISIGYNYGRDDDGAVVYVGNRIKYGDLVVLSTVNGEPKTFIDEAYRTLIFYTPPTGALLTWLQANAAKQVDTEYLTRKSELISVAAAIRAKGGTSAQLVYPMGFVSAIQAIETGGGSGSDELINSLIDRTISGAYVNNTVTVIGVYGLAGCTKLTSVVLPAVRIMDGNSMSGCSEITKADFSNLQTIRYSTFYNNKKLIALIIRRHAVTTLDNTTNVFRNTPIESGTGYIYVPSAMVSDYKSATNWSTYADQIRAIEDYPDITGG